MKKYFNMNDILGNSVFAGILNMKLVKKMWSSREETRTKMRHAALCICFARRAGFSSAKHFWVSFLFIFCLDWTWGFKKKIQSTLWLAAMLMGFVSEFSQLTNKPLKWDSASMLPILLMSLNIVFFSMSPPNSLFCLQDVQRPQQAASLRGPRWQRAIFSFFSPHRPPGQKPQRLHSQIEPRD